MGEWDILHQYIQKANKYAKDVTSGKIDSCKWVKAACKRQLDDLKRWSKKSDPYYFDKDAGNRVCEFIENLPHVKGKWAGTNQTLEPWQCFVWSTSFGWMRSKDNKRRFREIYLEVPRKNGKSIESASIGLYLFIEGEPGAEIYAGATTEKQAWEVFRPAKLMALKADGFANHYGINVNASNIHCLSTASRFEPLIGNPGDGASPHGALVDEYHEHNTPNLYDTMITGMGSREQPMMVVTTTAGSNTAGPCYDKRNQVCRILDKVEGFENNEIFGIIYTIDDSDDWSDFKVWKKANPNFGVSVFEDYLKSRHTEAIQRASRQNIIRCKHLNQWMTAGEAFFDPLKWAACADETLDIGDFKGQSCWVGLDLASKIDLSAMVVLFRVDGVYYVFPRFYLPEDATEGEDKTHYQTWVIEGHITTTIGSMIDYDVIEEDLKQLNRDYNVIEVPHDPWNAAQFVGHMQKVKIPMVEVSQTVGKMSDPMKELEAIILEDRIRHNGNPVLSWCMSNTVAKIDKKDNVYPYKERAENKIDGTIALIMALSRALAAEERVSKYETEGMAMI